MLPRCCAFYLHTKNHTHARAPQPAGVSATVDVQFVDLSVMAEPGAAGCLSLCLCSDGVWDNWKFPDIVNELVSPT